MVRDAAKWLMVLNGRLIKVNEAIRRDERHYFCGQIENWI